MGTLQLPYEPLAGLIRLLHLALSSGVLQQNMMCLPLAGICVALTGLCLLTDSLGHTKD